MFDSFLSRHLTVLAHWCLPPCGMGLPAQGSRSVNPSASGLRLAATVALATSRRLTSPTLPPYPGWVKAGVGGFLDFGRLDAL